MDKYFSQKDIDQVIDFLNFMSDKAVFNNWTTKDSVTHVRFLSHMQSVILPKMKGLILEVEEVIKAKEETNKAE